MIPDVTAELRCVSAIAAGNCDSSQQRFAYRSETHACEPVAACDGTDNQFDSEQDCRDNCTGPVLCPGAPALFGQPCAQAGASCSNVTFYGLWGSCLCDGATMTWTCQL